MNEEIKSSEVKVVVDGVVSVYGIEDALKLADEVGLDLVQVAENDGVPLCKLMDYSKYLFKQAKLAKNNKAKKVELKEVRLTWKISKHDLATKVKNIKRIIEKDGDRVKVTILYKGRELAMVDRGYEIMDEISKELDGVGKLTSNGVKFDGNNVSGIYEAVK